MLDDLDALNWPVPESAIDQTVADMEAVAQSAGVGRQESSNYLDEGLAIADHLGPVDGVPRAFDPVLYFSNHLTGFVHAGPRPCGSPTRAGSASR